MPWESVVGGLVKPIVGHLAKRGIQLFQDYARPWIKTTINRTHAERYLSLSSTQLCSLYSSEIPLFYQFGEKSYVLPMSLVIPPTCSESIENEEITLSLQSDKYEVPPRISTYTSPLIERLQKGTDSRLFDGEVVRLHALEKNNDNKWLLKVARASYFEALATNFAMDHCPSMVSQSLRSLISGHTRILGNFEESPLVNHIGVVCMVESEDGMLVVQKRSSKVANRPASLSSSVSGALNWDDMKNQHEWSISGLASGTLRESFEELGVRPKKIWFLGLIREYLRGGKPEFYFFAKSDRPYHEIIKRRKTAQDRSESTGIVAYEFHTDSIDKTINSQLAFYDRVIKVLERTGKEANLTLVVGICLTADRLLRIKSGEKTQQ